MHPNSVERGKKKEKEKKLRDIPLGKTTGTKKIQSISLR